MKVIKELIKTIQYDFDNGHFEHQEDSRLPVPLNKFVRISIDKEDLRALKKLVSEYEVLKEDLFRANLRLDECVCLE